MKGIVFDLDGVLTNTAKLHAAAWEKVFNEFLSDRGEKPFVRGEDYRRYLDGKPREDGIRSFLNSREITVNENLISTLGKKKNEYYLEYLHAWGPMLIEDSFSFVLRMFHNSIPMAVVSSSRNASLILKQTGLDRFIKILVDPSRDESEKLDGKPSPDYFLKACELMKVSPLECYMVEDAISGIEAGVKAKFKKVIGIKVTNDPLGMQELKTAGANEVVSSLWDISGLEDILRIQDAYRSFDHLFLHKNNYFLFLDFDGTISEIVEDPSEARPVSGVTEIISKLAERMPVCIITGRDTPVIRNLIKLPHIYYSGCHGFEISGPGNYHFDLKEARELIPLFDEAQDYFSHEFDLLEGIVIERKKFGLAFHYRKIHDEKTVNEIVQKVQDYCQGHQEFKLKPGEEVIEMLPNIDWDKGKSLQKLYDVLKLSRSELPPLYFGDGQTDEDAFREMLTWGEPVLVGAQQKPTLARHHLNGPKETKRFLEKILSTLENRSGRMEVNL